LIGDAPTKIPNLPKTLLQIIKWSKVINKSQNKDIVTFLEETQKVIKKNK
jgi:hypothetical protein